MKRLLLIGVLFIGFVVTSLLVIVPRGQAQGPGNEESKIKRGFEIAPVPLDVAGKNRSLVGLGSYIVNAQGDCNGCHTVDFSPYLPGGDPFAGETEMIDPDRYLVGGSAFGPFISRNLRPDADGLPAGYTFEEFQTVLRTGADLKGLPPAPLLQVMPWPTFRNMTDRDIRAIYEYLSALPPHAGFPE
ncbi:MAG: cytochrome C [Blastocatellia bacterium]